MKLDNDAAEIIAAAKAIEQQWPSLGKEQLLSIALTVWQVRVSKEPVQSVVQSMLTKRPNDEHIG